MSDDRRERILVRLQAILETVAGEGIFVYRDRAELESEELPAYVLLDGVETREHGSTEQGGRRAPSIMAMSPQIFYVPVPTENRKNEGVGPLLSQHRNILVRAIMRDGELANLTGDNGYVEYRGMETDMQTGAEVKGQLRLDFAIAYVLNISKL
jgi:hypothetical protein